MPAKFDAERFPYQVELAPGCYKGPDAPVASRHRTLDAALKAARKSDRLAIYGHSEGRLVAIAPCPTTGRLGKPWPQA